MTDKPYFRWLIVVLLLLLAVVQAINAVRFVIYTAAQSADMPLGVTLLPAFEFVASSLWTLLFSWTALRLIRAVPAARLHALRLLFAFALYHVLRVIVFARADYDRQRIPFLLITLAAAFAIAVVMSIILKRIRR